MKKILHFLASKRGKQILGVFIFFAVLGIGMFSNNVYAADEAIKDLSLSESLNILLKIVYLLVHVCIILAGWLLDNSMVYGGMFHLDAPLWKFWNITKNFANFILGFLVLVSIIKSIFSMKGADEPFKIIKQTLIAGVLIQASWFLLAAVIDISTIATYAVGGIPLNVLKGSAIGNTRVLGVQSTIDFNTVLNSDDKREAIDGIQIMYTYGNNVLGKCLIKDNSIVGIMGFDKINTRMAEPDYEKKVFRDDLCILHGNVVAKFDPLIYFGGNKKTNETAGTIKNLNEGFYENDIKNKYDIPNPNPKPNLFKGDNGKVNMCKMISDANGDGGIGLGTTIGSLLKKNDGFQGPLSALYYSMLDFGSLSDVSSNSSIGDMSMEFIIKSIVAIALFLPLILLVFVLFVRIGYLWIIIAFSPIYVLKNLDELKFTVPILGGEHDKLSGIMKAIFAPVITVFALSISLIFMSALMGTMNNQCDTTASGLANNESVIQQLGLEVTNNNKDKTQDIKILGGLSTISYEVPDNITEGGILDMFSRLLINLLGIGIVRTILFAAIKANEIGKMVESKLNLKEFGQKMLMTMPIVPLGNGTYTGISNLGNIIAKQPDNITTLVSKDNDKNIEDAFNIGLNKDIGVSDNKMSIDNYSSLLNAMANKNVKDIDRAYNYANIRPTDKDGKEMERNFETLNASLTNNPVAMNSFLEEYNKLPEEAKKNIKDKGFFKEFSTDAQTRITRQEDTMKNIREQPSKSFLATRISNLTNDEKDVLPDSFDVSIKETIDGKQLDKSYTIKKMKPTTGGEKYVVMDSDIATNVEGFKTKTKTEVETEINGITDNPTKDKYKEQTILYKEVTGSGSTATSTIKLGNVIIGQNNVATVSSL